MADTQVVRIASFNAALNRPTPGGLVAELASGASRQAQRLAQIVQLVRPNILAVLELDFDGTQRAADLFHNDYLMRSWNGSTAIHYPYRRQFPSNTGVALPFDLNRDGKIALPEDAHGFGAHEGQYAFALFSQIPLNVADARSFRHLRWASMPNNLLPTASEECPTGIPREAAAVLRLSSKNHVDVPISGSNVHLIIAHPTPPIFDGPERRNAKRNHDEIRLIADYLSGGERADYIVDDSQRAGGLPEDAEFVVLGDMNADPYDGVSHAGAIWQLLRHPRVAASPAYGLLTPSSRGALQNADQPMPGMPEAREHERSNPRRGNATFHTTVWKLRVDYVLPSARLATEQTGVFWPVAEHQHAHLVAGTSSSDHRLVWADVRLPELS